MSGQPVDRELGRGLGLFNRGLFFDAHEVLEDVWRAAPADSALRLHLQGMVQLAVAFHHHSTGNLVGARSVLERGMRNLTGGDRSFPDLDLDRLHTELESWRRYLNDRANAPNHAPNHAPHDAPHDARHHSPALPKILLRR